MPTAKIYFHETWSYEIGSLHEGFLNYNSNQKEMYLCIKESAQKASDLIKAEIIPTGDVVQLVRENISEFDYENGGISLCRDSFHLSEDYGRFLAGAVWFKKLTGKNLKEQPSHTIHYGHIIDGENVIDEVLVSIMNFDYDILKKLIKVINEKV